ncbi:MAG TPA: cytochrome c [Acidimicrobiia bacterium]|nr:cytochrome c [Acidimicrobiia bacterium]
MTAVIVVLLAGATVAVYALDPGPQPEAAAADSIEGRTVFLTKGCTGCHSREGDSDTGFSGPDLTGLAERAANRVEGLSAEEYVRQSVLDPQAYIVDGYGSHMPVLPVDSAELEALVDYLLGEG